MLLVYRRLLQLDIGNRALGIGTLFLGFFILGALPTIASKPVPAPDLNAAIEAAEDLPRLHSLLVSRQGKLILERYFNGKNASSLANMKSASKSVISAMVGIAIDRGLIESVHQPLTAFFPEYLEGNENAPKREITVKDLLTMQSGLETTSNRNFGAWVLSGDWVRYALNQPLEHPPGTRMEYSTGNTHLLSAILTRVSGSSTWEFAQETLAAPLGFRLARWPQDQQGIYFGGNDMLMTPRQMLAFGELYVNGGRYQGRQIVSAQWVKDSFVPYARSRRQGDRFYGYGWWIREFAGYPTFYAWGYGGQYIFLVPDLNLVVVATSSSMVSPERRAHRRRLSDLVERLVIQPLAEAGMGLPSAAGR